MVYFDKKRWMVVVLLFFMGNMAVGIDAKGEDTSNAIEEDAVSYNTPEEEMPAQAVQNEIRETPRIGCATPEEFHRQLLENDGKTVTLTGDIVWNESKDSWFGVENETTVDMNGYSLIVEDNASIMLSGPIRFVGRNSRDKPLIVLEEGSSFMGVSGVTVLAEGENCVAVSMRNAVGLEAESVQAYGDGGIAVLIEGENEDALPISIRGDIIVSGDGATALQAESHLNLYQYSISATGENSVAVRTNGNVYALFSQIKGQSVAVESPGEVVFDSCEITPRQENAVNLTRKAIPEPIHITALLGQDFNMPDYIAFRFELNETEYDGFFSSEISFSYGNSHLVEWDASLVDTQKVGTYTLTAMPIEYQNFSGIAFEPIVGNVQIMDELPEIVNAFYVFDSLVLQLDTQISEGIPFVVNYKRDEKTDWTAYEDTVLGENNQTIMLRNFGAIAGKEEQEITFHIALTIQSQEKVTADFEFIGMPPLDDGGGDRDGGDQGDQGSLKKNNFKKNTKKDADVLKNVFRDVIQPAGEILRQLGKRTPDPAPEQLPIPQTSGTVFQTIDVDEPIEMAEETQSRNQIPLVPDRNDTSQNSQIDAVTVSRDAQHSGNQPAAKAPPDNTITTLTGNDIAYLVQANPYYLTFPDKDIRLLIPIEAFEKRPLLADEKLQVELTRDGKFFSVRILLNEKEVTDWSLNPLQVYLSMHDEGAENIYCYSDKEDEIQAETMINGEIMFRLSATGEYTVVTDESNQRDVAAVTDDPKEAVDIAKNQNGMDAYWIFTIVWILATIGWMLKKKG